MTVAGQTPWRNSTFNLVSLAVIISWINWILLFHWNKGIFSIAFKFTKELCFSCKSISCLLCYYYYYYHYCYYYIFLPEVPADDLSARFINLKPNTDYGVTISSRLGDKDGGSVELKKKTRKENNMLPHTNNNNNNNNQKHKSYWKQMFIE